jgi:hypothetical protein
MARATAPALREAFSRWLVGHENEDGETAGYCPLCEEPGQSTSPSASFNFDQGVFSCFSQCGGMRIDALIAVLKESGEWSSTTPTARKAVPLRKTARLTTPPRPLPSPQRLQELTERLLRNTEKLRYLRDNRGLSKKIIQRYRLGWDGHRYTIPIYDEDGELVNVRRYDPWSKDAKDKMVSWSRGTGSRRLYGLDALEEFETVILVEGEMDKLIGRQYGLPTLTHTGGATAWDPAWNGYFEGKKVFICYDCDTAGRRGARKVYDHLKKVAAEVHIITLPLPRDGDDLTNYFVDNDRSAAEFYVLMKEATEQAHRAATLQAQRTADPMSVSLEQTFNPDFVDKPLTFTATIAGKTMPPHHMPQRLEFACNEGGGGRCARCPISGRNHLELEISHNDPVALHLMGKNDDQRRKTLLKYASLPHTCPDVELEEIGQYAIEELILLPPADEQIGSTNKVDRRVFNVGQYASPVNAKARFTGVNTTSPLDGRAALVAWDSELAMSTIDQFQMTPEVRETLELFQPAADQTPLAKMREIVEDLQANVTKIVGRAPLHMAYDLVWHSVLGFRFKGVAVDKGWVELLVVGDTRTGKTETAQHLCHHYRAGVLTTCEGTTFAGLVGGVQKISEMWMVQWGIIPLNDRRLVILDEAGGLADKGILEQMSSVRSSGVAQINKIQSGETTARTRLIWLMNPIEGVTVESYANGAMDALRQLAHNPEDIARFDFAMAVTSQDVSAADINTRTPQRVPHHYTQERCSLLVNWVWSRTPNQVRWGRGVENYVLDVAQELGNDYVPDPPLIQVENVRMKIARLSVAVAGRLFSTDETGELLLVRREHVSAARRLLEGFYGMRSFGYANYSATVLRERREARQNTTQLREYLAAHDDVFETLRHCVSGSFRMRDFMDFGAMTQMEAQDAVRVLQQLRMIRRLSKGYIRAEPTLIEVVRTLERRS